MKMDAFGGGKTTGQLINTYALMCRQDEVLSVDVNSNSVKIFRSDLLPFPLRGQNINALLFMEWLNRRVDNLSRIYMNKVYVARKVGRDREAILRDSCALSIIDNFWVRRSDVNTSWEELKEKRDSNLALANTALTGTPYRIDYENLEKDTTSLFTIKGAFPKAIYCDYILKKGSNAEYEFVASELGKFLDVNVAIATKEDYGVVKCQIFTSEDSSMAHLSDLLHMTNYFETNNRYSSIYDYFSETGRTDLVRQLDRLFLFNYLVINTDFHEENMGVLYDPVSFQFTNIAPAFDFNSAFEPWDDVKFYDPWIVENIPMFVQNDLDFVEKLGSLGFRDVLFGLEDLSEEQKDCVWSRASYIVAAFEGMFSRKGV